MNKERILALADAVEKGSIKDLGFNMADWLSQPGRFLDRSGHGCGTTACLGGWAAHLAFGIDHLDFSLSFGEKSFLDIASAWLELNSFEELSLFFAHSADQFPNDITSTTAVACLRHFAETGIVDWNLAIGQ